MDIKVNAEWRNVMIIDAHAHLSKEPKYLDRIVNSGAIEQVWLMDVSFYGNRPVSTLGWIVASPEEILKVAKRYKGFFIPFGYLDFRKEPEIVDKLYEKGFIGLKAIRPPKPYNDPSYFPYYEKAQELKMPILFHTGQIAADTQEVVGENLSLGPMNMRPMMLETIASAFPSLTIIGAHLGTPPWFEEAFNAVRTCPNVYYDFSGLAYEDFIQWFIKHLDQKCAGGKYTTDKILFAIDSLYGRKDKNGHILKEAKFKEKLIRNVGYNYRWGEDVEKILRTNAKKIMAKCQNT